MATHTYNRTGNRSVTFDGNQLGTAQTSSGGDFTMAVFQNGARFYFTYQSTWYDYVGYGTATQLTKDMQTFDPSGTFEGSEAAQETLRAEYHVKMQALWAGLPVENINP